MPNPLKDPYEKEYNLHEARDNEEYESGINKSGSMCHHHTSMNVDIYTPIKKKR